jgi:L-aspartate oxidase
VAGLYAALKAARHGEDVLLLTKGDLTLSNTYYAQGGIAAAICHMDSKELHIEDTLAAGAGLCALDAVEVTVSEGVDRVLDLVNLGVDFDREGDSLALTREGAHRRRRVLHARGDATGREIALTLINLVRHDPRITVLEQCRAVDLALSQSGRCTGAMALDLSGGQFLKIHAGAVLLGWPDLQAHHEPGICDRGRNSHGRESRSQSGRHGVPSVSSHRPVQAGSKTFLLDI